MNASILKLLKVIGVTAAAGVAHSVAENLPQIIPLIPQQYQGLAAVIAAVALAYLKQPPSNGPTNDGSSNKPSSGLTAGVAGVLFLLVLLSGAASSHPRSPIVSFDVAAASTLPSSPLELYGQWTRLAVLPPTTGAAAADRVLLLDLVASPVPASVDRASHVPDPFFNLLEAPAR